MSKKKKKLQMTAEKIREASEKLRNYEKYMTNMINASDLKDRHKREQLLGKKAGCYKWWAEEKQLDLLLEKLVETSENREVVKKLLEFDGERYCIYVGQASSIRKRLRNHVNGNVGSSTLRFSLASLITKNKIDEFIKDLKIRYFIVNDKSELDSVEWVLINGKDGENVFRLLNIEENKPEKQVAKDVISTLKKRRGEYKK